MTSQANLEAPCRWSNAHGHSLTLSTTRPCDEATAPDRRDYLAPVIGFAGFIGFWYFMSYWALEHIWNKPSFLITPPHRVINVSFFEEINRTALLKGLYWTARVSSFRAWSSPSCWGWRWRL